MKCNRSLCNRMLCMAGVVTAVILTVTAASSSASRRNGDAELRRRQLAVVEGKNIRIRLQDIESVASTQSPAQQRSLMAEPSARRAFLERIIHMQLLAIEATRRGYDQNPEVQNVRKTRLANLMHRNLSAPFRFYEPEEAELRAFYDNHREDFQKSEKIRVRHIVTAKPAEAEALIAEIRKEDLSQYRFRQLVQEYSIDEETREQGGDLSFFARDGKRGRDVAPVDLSIARSAFQIQKNGDIFPRPVKTDQGFHVLMRTGYRQPVNLRYEDAMERIRRQVQQQHLEQKTEEAIDALSKRYEVTVFEENLKHVIIDLSPESVPGTIPIPPAARERRRPR